MNQMGGNGRVEVINSKGCSWHFLDITSTFGTSFRTFQPSEPNTSPATSSSSLLYPFSGLVICVTGLSKEARKQVMEATERLGGQYSPHLRPQCTHLVVQSSRGLKFEHALKHGLTNGLFMVTLGWFVDSVTRNVRLSESLYSVKSVGENYMPKNDLNSLVYTAASENSCLPVGVLEHAMKSDMIDGSRLRSSEEEPKRRRGSILSGQSFYVDEDVSAELQNKVVEAAFGEGATLVDQWLVGRNATHVVCEGSSVRKYIGHSNNLVTPLWVLKTAKEKRLQRVVHLSVDLARQVGMMLENVQSGIDGEMVVHLSVDLAHQVGMMLENVQSGIDGEDSFGANGSRDAHSLRIKASHEENEKIANLAKKGVRNRRGRRMQLMLVISSHESTCQTSIRPLTPSILLDSICWSISEPSSSASIYTDSFSFEDSKTSVFFDANEDGKESEASFVNFSRPLTDSEKNELVFKNHFLTILFPVDRFYEMGPCSRTFFSDIGFTCLQLLDYIYAFYQESMSALEIELAIHTDSRHADRLRSMYSSKEAEKHGYVEFKRIEFLGSRKSFEMLKRVAGDNNSNVYELLTRA